MVEFITITKKNKKKTTGWFGEMDGSELGMCGSVPILQGTCRV